MTTLTAVRTDTSADAAGILSQSEWVVPLRTREFDARLAIELDGGKVRLISGSRGATAPLWLEPILGQLPTLFALKQGWDTYGARVVSVDRLAALLSALTRTLPWDGPAPTLVPDATGDIAAIWDGGSSEVELDTSGPEPKLVWTEDDGTVWVGPLRDRYREFRDWLMSQSHLAET